MGSNAGSTLTSGSDNNVFHKKRRFIVTSTFPGHSICLPIFTYGNRGCNKNVKALQHGIVYSQGLEPRLTPGEPALGYDPIMMIPTSSEKLSSVSRINYAKPQSVEHNTKVHFIGHIDESHTGSILQNMLHAMQNHKLDT
ncbi:hypothetical protein SPBR_07979 [Sporothrix brasiliensis 5110]|uniref:DUF6590 domain-containing protein n=1 Tax=Sporothrix brasiliensis 5110 TaxID=1398154 RepID=A0A0C2INS9_9PEZI|nr:uncharacterized protein SPBR_07979 [Sporothrix brasiliensis 5110]KIH88620.1 hypothetical protein SPBR_07979 [Sporothrix brasiliensis 5110]